ncbi:MAG: hypothetical protein EXR21_09515 [Flavobacteriaceae bacterium]|nr:hypothetical protein [Flavobacteriaceae bacterium]
MPNTEQDSAQRRLFAYINETFGKKYNIAQELQDLLKVSADSAYRRMRCETPLSFDEFALICQEWHLPFEMFINAKSRGIVFEKFEHGSVDTAILSHINSIVDFAKSLTNMPGTMLYQINEELKILRIFNSELFSAFKIFVWNKSFLNNARLEGKKFSPAFVSEVKEQLQQSALMNGFYQHTDSTEIFFDEILDVYIKQLVYYHESGFIDSPKTSLALLNELRQILEQLQEDINRGYKTRNGDGKITAYFSEIPLLNGVFLVKSHEGLRMFQGLQTLDYLTTTNEAYCKEVLERIENCFKRCIRLDGAAEKVRHQYFARLFARLDKAEEQLAK